MRFPSLVRGSVCTTPVLLTLYGEGLSEDGAPLIINEYRVVYPSDALFPSDALHGDPVFCNYRDGAKTVLTKEKKKVEVSGVILIPGDICPHAAAISGGFAEIFGERREIVRGIKARNPDGTVNFTELDVM